MREMEGGCAAVEVLETRIAPATIAGFTYTDASGDIVKVSFEGTADSVTVLNALSEDLAAGNSGDIASVVIDGPNAGFRMVITDTNPGFGGDVVELGSISGPAGARLPSIAGILTVDNGSGATYNLSSYKGTGFSSNGGLTILGALTGSSADIDLDLLSLGASAKVQFRDGFAAGAVGKIDGAVAGQIRVGDMAAGSSLSTDSVINLLKVGTMAGTASVTVSGNVVGRVEIGNRPADPDPDPAVGQFFVTGSIGSSGIVSSAGDLNLKVGNELRGLVESFDDVTLEVGKGIVGGYVIAGGELEFTANTVLARSVVMAGEGISASKVTKDVAASSIVGGSGLSLEIGGSLVGATLGGGTASVNVDVVGKVTASQIMAGDNMDVTIGLDVTSAKINADGYLSVTIGKSVTRSQIASNASSVELTVGGNVIGSKILGADTVDLDVSGDFKANSVVAGEDIAATFKKTVAATDFSAGSDVDFTAGGNVMGSSLLAENVLSVDVTGALTGSYLETRDGSADVYVTGAIAKTAIRSGIDVVISRSASMSADVFVDASKNAQLTSDGNIGARITAGGDVDVYAGAIFSGAIRSGKDAQLVAASVAITGAIPKVPILATATTIKVPTNGIWVGGNLALDVTGNVVVPTISVSHDVEDFSVGGNLLATVRVGGNFVAGTSQDTAVTVVGGSVLQSSFIEVGGNLGGEIETTGGLVDTAQKLVFGGAVLGRIEVAGKLRTDLQFGSSVARLTFAGGVGPAVGTNSDTIADIVAAGRIAVLAAGSYFTPTASGGTYADSSGTTIGNVNATIGTII